jgi:prepilin-type N-terminal cleavage/methylation domain-containing protein
MKDKWKPFSRKSRRGVTLIEVVAGLVVLAVLISAVTMARGRLLRGWSEGQKKLQATQAVDRMLAGWIGGGGSDSIPVPGQGMLEGVEECAWRTSWIAGGSANRLGAGVVRLEVLQAGKRVIVIEILKHRRTRADREDQP